MLLKKPLVNCPFVLAIDDDRDNLHLMKYVVEALSLKCYGIGEGKMVLDLAIEKKPKLILLDIVMPQVSGFDVIRQLKTNLFTRNIPVIAVTGLADVDCQARIKKAGFEDYICKPFLLEELERKIAKHLNICVLQTAA